MTYSSVDVQPPQRGSSHTAILLVFTINQLILRYYYYTSTISNIYLIQVFKSKLDSLSTQSTYSRNSIMFSSSNF